MLSATYSFNLFHLVRLPLLLFKQQSANNASAVTVQLLKKLDVPVTLSTAIKTVEEHPDYPSLLSISNSLKKWKVDNIALEIEKDKLDHLPLPFIVHIKSSGETFQLVTGVDSTVVQYILPSGKEAQKKREEFLNGWSGVVLLAEASAASGEKEYAVQRRKEWMHSARIPFILITCLLLIVGFTLSTIQPLNFSTLSLGLLLLFKLAGAIITGLLLWYEIDKANPVLQQICTGGKSTNCNAVLQSKGARLFNWLSWSEVGFFYFAGGFIFLLSSGNNQPSSFSLLSWLNLLALPYTIFSLFYQWRIARQWCPLCLAVQGLLIAEAVVCYFGYWNVVTYQRINYSTLLTALTSFAIPVFFWVFVKSILLKAQRADQKDKELNRLKYNTQIFNALLPKQKQVTVSPDGLGIALGNPAATNTIIKVCNPYCGPCAKAHPVIDELIEDNENVKVQIIFTATDEENDHRAQPVKHLMALEEKGDVALIHKALNDWYGAEKKDYDLFAQKYSLNGELQRQGEKLAAMDKWCKDLQISFTPTFFVNGYQLPEVYKIEDVKYLLI